MTTPSSKAVVAAGQTLQQLIDQFTDPFAFLRELIQNSIDAGTTRVDVEMEFRPYEESETEEDPKGIWILHVIDTGCGMNREIIDTRLTRLFSSSKENDFTTVGKFGIGFVSIFALNPKAVIVDTGRDGEYWRIFFKEDKTFDRIILNQPIEGTHIRLIKEISKSTYEEYYKRSRNTIIFWCKHVETEIYFDGELINQEFSLNAPYSVHYQVPGTSIVVAPSSEKEPFYGFYNQGLTLEEGRKTFIPGVQFKINSRYLEHTLTRDTIIQDDNYHKAMQLLQDTVRGPLCTKLFQEAAKGKDQRLYRYLIPHLHLYNRPYETSKRPHIPLCQGSSVPYLDLPAHLAKRPLIPTLQGKLISIAELNERAYKDQEIFWDHTTSPVTTKLAQEGIPVIKWEGEQIQPELGAFLRSIIGHETPLLRANESWALPTPIDNLPPSHQKLIQQAVDILHKAGCPYKEVVPADFMYPESTVGDRLYLIQKKRGKLIRIKKQEKEGGWNFLTNLLFGKSKGKILLLNVKHDLIAPHFDLMERHPKLAAYLLAKAITLDDGLDPVTDTRLIEAALSFGSP